MVRQRTEFSVLTLFKEIKPVVMENCHNEYCVSSQNVHKFGIIHPSKLQSKDPGELFFRKGFSHWNWSFDCDHDRGVQVVSYRTIRFRGSILNAKLHTFLFLLGNIRIVMKRSQQKVLSKSFLPQVWSYNLDFDERIRVCFHFETFWLSIKNKIMTFMELQNHQRVDGMIEENDFSNNFSSAIVEFSTETLLQERKHAVLSDCESESFYELLIFSHSRKLGISRFRAMIPEYDFLKKSSSTF